MFSLIGKLFGADIGNYAEHNTCFTNWIGFILGIGGFGGGGSSVVSFSTPSGASRSLGGITIGLYPGIRAVGGLNSISIVGRALGTLGRFTCTIELLS